MQVVWAVAGWVACLGMTGLGSEAAYAASPLRPVIVFDLDRTLFDPTPRIAAIVRDVKGPGTRAQFADSTKPHGARFLLDARYLVLDTVVPGAAGAVAHVQKLLDADVLYLSGRYREPMWQATVEQLRKGDFPGFGRRSSLRSRVRLQLRELTDQRSVVDYKLAHLARIGPPWRVAAIFDDSGRNLEAFWSAGYRREIGVELVRMTGLAPLAPGLPEPAWLCLKDFAEPESRKRLENWLNRTARCEQLTLGEDYFR